MTRIFYSFFAFAALGCQHSGDKSSIDPDATTPYRLFMDEEEAREAADADAKYNERCKAVFIGSCGGGGSPIGGSP